MIKGRTRTSAGEMVMKAKLRYGKIKLDESIITVEGTINSKFILRKESHKKVL